MTGMTGMPLDVETKFRFPFREKGESDQDLHAKFRRVQRLITANEDVVDTYYEEDEQYGLFVEISIRMDSVLVKKSIQELYDMLWSSLSTMYSINECY